MASDSFAALNSKCASVFGKPLLYQPAAGAPFTINGIPEKRVEEERVVPDGAVNQYLQVFVNSADFAAAPVRGDQATVDGTLYKVFDVKQDAGGGIWLFLRQA